MEEITKKIDFKKEAMEWVYSIIIALGIALLIRYFVFTPTMVRQVSMYPTLHDGERLFLSRMIRNTKTLPEKGDIITFEAPYANAKSKEEPTAYYEDSKGVLNSFSKNFLEIGKVSYIKRVIGLPGDKISIREGKVYVNDVELDEPYLVEGLKTESMGGEFTEITVPQNCVFAMGDNRDESKDSREFGCIPIEKIEGKVIVRIWPLNKFGEV